MVAFNPYKTMSTYSPTNTHVLLISQDVVGTRMAGPGIRYLWLARTLANTCTVTLAAPQQEDQMIGEERIRIVSYVPHDWKSLQHLAEAADVVVVNADLADEFAEIADLTASVVIDGYDPLMAEWLQLGSALDLDTMEREWRQRIAGLARQFVVGDFFICATERQRDWWLGQLDVHGRINPKTYRADPTLRNLIDVVATGMPADAPIGGPPVIKDVWPGIAKNDPLILWGGGLWPWLDPLNLIRAMPAVLREIPNVRLAFPGTKRPNQDMQGMPLHVVEAVRLSEELGLLNHSVFFGDWVPYEAWPQVLLESDLAVTLHVESLESHLAFRTRVLDNIWAGVPTIASSGDVTADMLPRYGIGEVLTDHDSEHLAAAIVRWLRKTRESLQLLFADARADLAWEKTAWPLIAFCARPHRAADRPAGQSLVVNTYSLLVDARRAAESMAQRTVREADEKIRHALREAEIARVQVAALEEDRRRLQVSAGYGVLTRLQRLRAGLLPVRSRREKLFETGVAWLSNIRTQGLRTATVEAIRDFSRSARVAAPPTLDEQLRDWIERSEPSAAVLDQQRARSGELEYRPLISIVTPVFNPPPDVLRQTLASYLAQTYDNFEICLADGGSTRPGVREVLEEISASDARVRVTYLDSNRGIAGNSNAALQMVQGEFVALFDHDDLLAPHAMFEVVNRLNVERDADIVYFDEDKVSADGSRRHSPWFKPGRLSPDLMLSTNQLMHCVVRRTLLEELGGFDPATDGAQDWDLMLRVVERTDRIAHVAGILYHWRQVDGSASVDPNAKPWAIDGQRRALEGHLRRIGAEKASVFIDTSGGIRVFWSNTDVRASIIIPTKDNVDLLKACVSSILSLTRHPAYEIVLVDTGSVDPSTEEYYRTLSDDPRVRLLRYAQPFNWSAVNNYAAHRCDSDVLVFLNNDTEVRAADWLSELCGWAMRPEVGVVGCKLVRPDGTIQHAGIVMGLEGHGSHVFDGGPDRHYGPFGSTEWYRNYQAVTGACMSVRRSVFEKIGEFDEAYVVGYSDIEFCLRAVEAGLRIVYTPHAALMHVEGGTRGFTLPPADVLRATLRMMQYVREGDPFWNPCLSYADRLPRIAHPNDESRTARLSRILQGFGLAEPYAMEFVAKDEAALARSVLAADTRRASRRSRRIVLISHEMTLSGAPLLLVWMAEHLKRAGYEVDIVCPHDGPLRRNAESASMSVLIEPRMFTDARVAAEVLAEYDLVVVNTIIGWRAVFAARALARPVLWWLHETQVGREKIKETPQIVKALEAANTVVCPTRATMNAYEGASTQKNFVVAPYGIARPQITRPLRQVLQQRKATQDGRIRFLCVATIETRKGQDVLLNALAQVPSDVRNRIECVLVGRDNEPAFHRSIVAAAKALGNVRLLGELPHEEVLAEIANSDVFVLASRDEALPVTVLEAMSLGKPVLATAVGGLSEAIVHGESGLLVSNGDSKALAVHMAALAADPELRVRLGSAAADRYQHAFTDEIFAARMLELIGRMSNTNASS